MESWMVKLCKILCIHVWLYVYVLMIISSTQRIYRCYGPKHLIEPIVSLNQWVHFCVSTPTQVALSRILEYCDKPYADEEGNKHQNYFTYICNDYQQRRNHLMESIRIGETIHIK